MFTYYYTTTTSHLGAFFQDNLGKPAPESRTILDFTGARDDVVAVASVGPYAIAPHSRQITMPVPHHSGRMPFLPPNQQHQSTEGITY